MGSKSPLASLTVWGLAILAGLGALEQSGVVPPGTPTTLADAGQALAGLIALWGRWRAQTTLRLKT
jgi:hypothetical protein